jgi:hypothetical protein
MGIAIVLFREVQWPREKKAGKNREHGFWSFVQKTFGGQK